MPQEADSIIKALHLHAHKSRPHVLTWHFRLLLFSTAQRKHAPPPTCTHCACLLLLRLILLRDMASTSGGILLSTPLLLERPRVVSLLLSPTLPSDIRSRYCVCCYALRFIGKACSERRRCVIPSPHTHTRTHPYFYVSTCKRVWTMRILQVRVCELSPPPSRAV